jgi:hypothetical protein
MNQQCKLILALQQVENITNLVIDNPWENYLVSHLIPLKYELERQITNNSICNAAAQSPNAENKNATKKEVG